MCPEIRVEGKLIADVPDETGMHQTLNGKPLYVNVDGIDANRQKQEIILSSKEIGGRRILGLTLEGIGSSSDRKRGDGKLPQISVTLLSRPIRVTYSPLVPDAYAGYQIRDPRQTHKNPYWIRGQGQR